MIRRELIMAAAIIASVVITACSDMTGPVEMQAREFAGRPSFVEASRQCPAPGTDLAGAFNMIHDATMFTIPGVRAADQGIVGMFHAVDVSGCWPCASRP